MTVREGTVDSGGVRLHYLDWGGDGPPLILLHATGFHAKLWDPIATQLTARYRVLAYDQRGHGDSDGPDDGYSFEQFAEDLDAVIQALGLGRARAAGARDAASIVCAGHSSGASTILVHGALYPGVIDRIVLFEPILPPKDWQRSGANERAEQAGKRRALWPDHESIYQSYRGRGPFASWRDDMLRLYIEAGTRRRPDGQLELKCPPHLEAKYYEAVRDADFYPLLERVQTPSLFVWGAKGDLRQRTGDAAEAAVANSESITVPSVGHLLVMEQPDEVASLLKDAFANVPAGQTVRS